MQIGACYFDRETGETGLTFTANVEAGSRHDDFTTDLDTMKWWLGNSPEARSSINRRAIPLVSALSGLKDFLLIGGADTKLWSHATFDMPILANAFKVYGIQNPIPFRNMRDLRTLMGLANHHSNAVREGTHHDALDDALFQATYAMEALNIIKNSIHAADKQSKEI